jgi:hypothetical protein
LTGVAVNVTDVPEQTAPEGSAVILSLTGNEFTVIVRASDVAGEPVAHASEEVNSHVTTSPSPGAYS